MDVFYRPENIDVFRKWVYYRIKNDSRFTLEEKNEQTYLIHYNNRVATFTVWPMGIIEETVNEDEKILFYLHFKFRNFHFCVDMFQRMIDVLVQEEKKEVKILLCCTGGMTTGFFAEKMNTYCELNDLPYTVAASPIYHLDNIYMNYDYLLIAPQLKYKLSELTQKYQSIKVRSIKPSTFATYNCAELLKEIEDIN